MWLATISHIFNIICIKSKITYILTEFKFTIFVYNYRFRIL
nr:MAG TPA: hypothetical protein [Bacteriophage sp.]